MNRPDILLVEDNASDVELILRSLKKGEVLNKVIVARDGAEALDYIFCKGEFSDRDPKQLPGLVLLDLNLPKIGGFEVLDKIRANHQTELLPVVILTSSDEERDRLQAYTSRTNSYVCKQVEYGAFSEAVTKLGLFWLLLNRPPPELL